MEEEDSGVLTVKTERQILRQHRIVALVGEIGSRLACRFAEDMSLLRLTSKDPITIIISSNGGEVEYGLACVRAIHKAQQEGIHITGEVHGCAMSMAFLILQCCDKRTMGKPDVLMSHGFTTFTIGDMRNLESERKLLKIWQEYFANLIARRCVVEEYLNPNYWLPIMADNTPLFYSSEECLKMGLIDKVED